MQASPLSIERRNLSEEVAAAIRTMIVDGQLAAGERINEVHLAAGLGVSRTPLREALSSLVAEQALLRKPRIGYFVAPLTLAEFTQIYPIRAILDPAALRLAGIPPESRFQRLRALNEQIRRTRPGERVISLDDQWHLELVAGCNNSVLLGLIEQFMHRTRRYELALLREERQVRISTDEHDQVLSALQAGNLERGCLALLRNLQSGVEPILSWLKARASASPHPESAS